MMGRVRLEVLAIVALAILTADICRGSENESQLVKSSSAELNVRPEKEVESLQLNEPVQSKTCACAKAIEKSEVPQSAASETGSIGSVDKIKTQPKKLEPSVSESVIDKPSEEEGSTRSSKKKTKEPIVDESLTAPLETEAETVVDGEQEFDADAKEDEKEAPRGKSKGKESKKSQQKKKEKSDNKDGSDKKSRNKRDTKGKTSEKKTSSRKGSKGKNYRGKSRK